MAKSERQLVQQSLQKTCAHGLARLVNENVTYIRVLWLLAWLTCWCLFLRQLIGFINKLQDKEVTTNFRADHLPFEYPDLYFCYDNPISGSAHLMVGNESVAFIKSSFGESIVSIQHWCSELDDEDCLKFVSDEAAEVQMNSLPYRFLVDKLAHTKEQSILFGVVVRSNGLDFSFREVPITEFYHPTHLRCFRAALNATHREELKAVGPDDGMMFQLMMDAPDTRMGSSDLPVVRTTTANLSAPFWALDKSSLASRIRDSRILVYITQPGHYPSSHDEALYLDAGRTYSVSLELKEQVHKDDPSRCIEKHPDVQIVNPYDNSSYTVAYDYSFCYQRAVQAQFSRELGATCGFLPQPWPPSDRVLYNISSDWGSTEDIERYLARRQHLRPEEPLEKCEAMRPCTERSYKASVVSVTWPSVDTIESVFEDTNVLNNEYYPNAPGLRYLRELNAKGNASQQLAEYIRANFLQLQIKALKPKADQITFNQAYSIESFVADVGGILGIYLGMSVLTACEFVQFLHDLMLLCWRRDNSIGEDSEEGKSQGTSENSSQMTMDDHRAIK